MRRLLPNVVLAVGVCMALIALASQLVALPFLGGDFLNLAILGCLLATIALIVVVGSEGRGRRKAVAGLLFSLTPVLMLVISCLSPRVNINASELTGWPTSGRPLSTTPRADVPGALTPVMAILPGVAVGTTTPDPFSTDARGARGTPRGSDLDQVRRVAGSGAGATPRADGPGLGLA